MRGSVVLGVGAAAFLLLASCGGDDDGDACSQYFDALYGYETRCSLGEAAKTNANRARFMTVCANILNAPGASSIGAALSSCAAKVNGASCNDSAECDELEGVTGSLPDGSACLEDYQCASGGCDAKGNQCGKCVARAAVGQPCTPSIGCVKGSSCVVQNDTGTCREIVIAKAGEDCSSTDGLVIECDKGLGCAFGSDYTQPGKCQPLQPAGGTCRFVSDCQAGLICVVQDAGDAGVCGAGTPAGGDCSFDRPNCARGLICGDDGKCTAEVYVETGQTCDRTHSCLRGRCTNGALDSGAKGICEAPIPDGAPCEEYSSSNPTPKDCDSYAECINGTCQVSNPAVCK